MKDLISIIIPIFNSEKTLERCVNSALNQSYKNVEIILINDGSEDKTHEICDMYCNKDSRIVYVRQENKGQGKTRNEGLNKAHGKFITFLDSDDELPLDAIKQLYKYSKFDLSIGGFEKIDNGKKKIYQPLYEEIYGHNEIVKAITDSTKMLYINGITSKLFRNDIIQKYNIRFKDKKYGADTDFIYSYLRFISNLVLFSSVTYTVNVTFGSISLKPLNDAWKEMVEIFENGKQLANEDSVYVYILLMRSIKTSLLKSAKFSEQNFKITYERIKKYLIENNLNEYNYKTTKYNDLVYKLIVRGDFYILYVIFKIRVILSLFR